MLHNAYYWIILIHSVFAFVQYHFEHIQCLDPSRNDCRAEEGKRSVAVQDRQGQHCLTSFISHLCTITPSIAKAKNLSRALDNIALSVILSHSLSLSQFLFWRNLPNDPEVLEWASRLTIRAKRDELTVQEMNTHRDQGNYTRLPSQPARDLKLFCVLLQCQWLLQ